MLGAGLGSDHTDPGLLQPVADAVALVGLRTLEVSPSSTGSVVQPVDTGEEITDELVTQLGTVTVVYTGHLHPLQ